MGRTLPTSTIIFQQEEAAFSRFRRALRRSDQLALDDLFVSARQHLAAAQYAAHALPFEVLMLSMLLEEHKEVMKLREKLDSLSMATGKIPGSRCFDPGFGFDDMPEPDPAGPLRPKSLRDD
jgi:hypothetical protein